MESAAQFGHLLAAFEADLRLPSGTPSFAPISACPSLSRAVADLSVSAACFPFRAPEIVGFENVPSTFGGCSSHTSA